MPLGFAREIGQLLIGSFPATTVPQELRSLAKEFDLGGVILFSRNVEAPEQVVELAADSEALGRQSPAWVSVHQEGGRVARLKEPFTLQWRKVSWRQWELVCGAARAQSAYGMSGRIQSPRSLTIF